MKNKLITGVLFTLLLSSCGGSSTTQTYTITYELDGGIVTKGNPDTYSPDSEDFVLNKPYKQGYIFKGWLDSEENINLNQTIAKGTTGNLIFKAKYSKDSYARNGGEVDVNPNGVKEFLEAEDGDTANYLKDFVNKGSSIKDTSGVYVRWTNINKADTMTLTVATDKEYKDVITTLTTKELKTYLYNLYPNQEYYVKVMDSTDDLIFKDSFKLDGHLRTIKMDGVTNIRDIGGWTIDDGSTIPYGRIYRSSDLQVVADAGKETIKELGIKTEIDLRLQGQGSTAPVEGMNFINAGFWHWEHCFPGASSSTPSDATSIAGLSKAVKAFAVASNYPIVAHCSGGADRTSTLFFVIEGLLGMDYEDMAREHELTSFSSKGLRLRCGTKYDNESGKYVYDINSIETDKSGFVPSFDRVYQHVLNTYGQEGGSFKTAIEKYAKNVLSLSQEEIDNIRTNILL